MPKDSSKTFIRAICRVKWGNGWYNSNKKERMTEARSIYKLGGQPTDWQAFDAKTFVNPGMGALDGTKGAQPYRHPMSTLLKDRYKDPQCGLIPEGADYMYSYPGYSPHNGQTIYDQHEDMKALVHASPDAPLAAMLRENCCGYGKSQLHIESRSWAKFTLAEKTRARKTVCSGCGKCVETVFTHARCPGVD
jgi:hypothetical protein